MTCGLKTLSDAVDLRDRIFGAFEEAERTADPTAQAEWLTFVVVGGGPTGVEISGQLAILSRHTMKRDFRRIDPRTARVILLDAGERVVAAFSEQTSAKAASELGELGVTIREHAMVTNIDARGVTVKTGEETERIATRTVVWAAGVRTASIAEVLARATGAGTDRGGHVDVNPDLTLPGHPEISVIGDAAKLSGEDGKPLPGLATVAIQEARHVAEAICQGQPGASKPFKYFDKGALAVVGRGKAVWGQGTSALGSDRLPDVRGRAPVLSRWRQRPPSGCGDHGAWFYLRRSPEPSHGGRARACGTPGRASGAHGGTYLDSAMNGWRWEACIDAQCAGTLIVRTSGSPHRPRANCRSLLGRRRPERAADHAPDTRGSGSFAERFRWRSCELRIRFVTRARDDGGRSSFEDADQPAIGHRSSASALYSLLC